MLDEIYKDNLLPADQQLQQCEITLGIDASSIPKTQSKYFGLEIFLKCVFLL